MLTTSKEMIQKGYEGGYAIAAINTQGGTYDIIRAICKAAEELHAPVILAHYLSTGGYSGHDWFYQTAKWMAEQVDVPIAIHLDHGDSVPNCKKMLEIGFTSIMYDGSNLVLEENAKNTNQVIDFCHASGVPVEAEIGEIGRLDAHGNNLNKSNIADPEEVKSFLSLCQPDSLAVGIGNAHGFYAGKPEIHMEILDKVRSVTEIPFVLHGCTGMGDDLIELSKEYGVAKINFGTQIRYNYLKYLQEELSLDTHGGHTWKLSQQVELRLREDIKNIVRLAGSEGKA